MERKKLMIIGALVAAAVVVTTVVALKVRNSNVYMMDEISIAEAHEGDAAYIEGELIGSAETYEEAEKIADMYGISLINYSYGVALYRTKGDDTVDEIIKLGKDNGYPELTPNYTVTLD